MTAEAQPNPRRTLLACTLLLVAAAGALVAMFNTAPTAQRGGAVKRTAMLVDVERVERGRFRPTLVAAGTVVPARDIVFRPRVAGQIIARAPEFTAGGFVERGQVLVEIDPADFEHTLLRRRSELRLARTELALERGRQGVAEQDFALLGDGTSPEQAALLLRKPQLAAAQGRVEAAQAAVDQAELDLRRSKLAAPLAAHVLERSVDVGSQVSPGDALGRLVGIETYWVRVSLPLSQRRLVQFEDSTVGAQGSRVELRDRSAWPPGAVRRGRVLRFVGALDGGTRMARIVVGVDDPLARATDDPLEPPLVVGQFLEVRIEGVELPDVVRLDRALLRSADTVWLMDQGKLRIADVVVAARDAQHVYVSRGLATGDLVVRTDLATVAEGAALRLQTQPGGE